MLSTNTLWSYLKTGLLLHLITVGEMLLIWLLFHFFPFTTWLHQKNLLAHSFIQFLILWSPLFPQLDARSRFQDYKLMKDRFYEYGFDKRIVQPFTRSRCQRDAVLMAAKELGFGRQCEDFFKSKGYRWYYLIPDAVIKNPLIILSIKFWMNIFFAKPYRPKFDYRKLDQGKKTPGVYTLQHRLTPA